MQPGSEKSSLPIKPRRHFLRPLLATLVITSLLTAFAFMLLPRIGKSSPFDEGELKLGSTTFRFDFDDDEPDELFQHKSWDGRDGELSSGRRITIGLPLGTLELGYTHEPLDAIRKRLPNTVEGLTELLNSRDYFEVFAAAEALAENPTGAVIALPKLLAVAENSVYIAGAIEPIAFTAPKESLPTLISGLCSTNMQLRDYCGSILARLGTNALAAAPDILSAFHSKRIHVTTAALALQKITGDCSATVPALRDELKNGAPDQRVHILRALAEAGLHAASALPEVLTILNSSTEMRVQANALETLSRISSDESIILPHIEAALATSNSPAHTWNSRAEYHYHFFPSDRVAAAINALARLGSNGLPHLVSLYQGTNIPIKAAAARALAKIGPPAATASEAINVELQSSRVEDLALACNIVANLGTNVTPVLPTLTNLLFVPNLKIRAHAATTFTRLGHHNDTLTRILADSFADPSIATHVYRTVQPILKTNSNFKSVFNQRLALNRKAARLFQTHSAVFTEEATESLSHFCSLP